MPESSQSAQNPRDFRLPAAAGAIVLGLGCAGLLWRCLFEGRAQTFDTLLYARGLWGLGYAEFGNPVVEQNTFALHGHFALLPLAPLGRILPAALVLILVQAISLGAVFFMTSRALWRGADKPSTGAAALALWGAVLTIVLSPLVFNPFFFDARPDLPAVAFMTAALLRARDRGFDRRALLYLAGAALCREEFAIVAAAALALAPTTGKLAFPERRRIIAAAAFFAYFVIYFFGIRSLLNASDASAVLHLSGSAADGDPALIRAKVDLLLVFVLSAGGVVWLGWRWMPVALPGLGMLMISRWLPDMQLRFHYAMFAAPALIVAAVTGIERVRKMVRNRQVAVLALSAVLALFAYRYGGATPGGSRFARFNFDLADKESGGVRFDFSRHSTGYDAVHQRLAHIPDDHGIAVPWSFAAPVADRPFITTVAHLKARLLRDQTVDPRITTVALMKEDVLSVGRPLIFGHGFRLIGPTGFPVELFTRDPAFFPGKPQTSHAPNR